MEVVFTLLAERYERGQGIFKDPMTTAAAIDRLVHHSVIVELNVPSYCLEQARHNIQTGDQPIPEHPSGKPLPAPGSAPRLQPVHPSSTKMSSAANGGRCRS
jgi:hypothetical protein